MEVAANQTILLQRKINRVAPLPSDRRPLRMAPGTSKTDGTEATTNQIFSSAPLLLDVDVPSSSASDMTDPSPALLSMTPPPENETPKEGNSNDSQPTPEPTEGVALKKRKSMKKTEDKSTDGQKSRITRNRDDSNEIVVNNYVDSTEKRKVWPRVVPPNGLRRHPFKPPKGDLEKEKDKLKIHMVGPKTKTSLNAMEEVVVPKREQNVISEGPEFQADFEQYYAEDFQPPTVSAEDYPDRNDEVMWIDDRVKLKDKERELDEAWTAIRRTFGGKVGVDSMLRRLMKCNYDIDKMLTTIEEELESLPQPFEELNIAQQTEFEKQIRRTGNAQGKVFKSIQEKLLKGYYIGEIVKYYYDTKHRGCPQNLYHRCNCKENLVMEFPPTMRYECYNCTRYIWQVVIPDRSARGQSYCSVCELYFARRKKHRFPQVPLPENEEKVAKAWFELEKLKEKPVTKKEVLEYMEEKRQKQQNITEWADEVPAQYYKGKQVKPSPSELFELTKKFTSTTDSNCWTRTKWGSESRKLVAKEYTSSEKLEIVKAFQRYGYNLNGISEAIGRSVRELEVFYGRFYDELNLQKFCYPSKKDIWLGHPSLTQINIPRSTSATPEPTGRRKRAASTDPNYEVNREAPPMKTTRRTRQTQVTGIFEENEDSDGMIVEPTVVPAV